MVNLISMPEPASTKVAAPTESAPPQLEELQSMIDVRDLMPVWGDFNEDLQQLGADELRAALRVQLVPEDVLRFLR